MVYSKDHCVEKKKRKMLIATSDEPQSICASQRLTAPVYLNSLRVIFCVA